MFVLIHFVSLITKALHLATLNKEGLAFARVEKLRDAADGPREGHG